jgi:hypothetical protein
LLFQNKAEVLNLKYDIRYVFFRELRIFSYAFTEKPSCYSSNSRLEKDGVHCR